MGRRFFFVLPLLSLALPAIAGCTVEPSDDVSIAEDDVKARPPVTPPTAEKMAYSLPTAKESLLVADDGGNVALVRVGLSSDKRIVALPKPGRLVAGRALAGRFLVLTDAGALVSIDAEKAVATSSVSVGWKNAHDIEVLADGRVLVASGSAAKVREVSPTTGKAIREVDLSGRASSVGSLVTVAGRIVVQLRRGTVDKPGQGAIAVLDEKTLEVVAVVELSANDDREPSKAVVGTNPGGPMIVDTISNQLFVGALGQNSVGTGGLFRVATDTWKVRGAELARAGYQGPSSERAAGGRMFITYHTRTPVSSTHVFAFKVDATGRPIVDGQGAILDAFEEVEAMPGNATQSLFALPISCPVGFCIGGAGVAFVSAADPQPPRLLATALGLKPTFALFAR